MSLHASAKRRPHLLLVEDNRQVAAIVARYLEHHGMRCSSASTAGAMEEMHGQVSIDLMLLDLGLPDKDGLTLVHQIGRQTPVIIVSGRGETVDRVAALELGADDYMDKPFELRELLARIRAVLRRRGISVLQSSSSSVLGFDGEQLSLDRRALVDRQGREVSLTRTEFTLLMALVNRSGQVVTRDELMDHLSDHTHEPFDREIDAHVMRLRRKVERDPTHPRLIRSVRGAGYMFAAHVDRHGHAIPT